MLNPDWVRLIYLSTMEIVFIDFVLWMFRESKSTFEREIIVLAITVELRSIGRFFERVLPYRDICFILSTLYIIKLIIRNI